MSASVDAGKVVERLAARIAELETDLAVAKVRLDSLQKEKKEETE